MKGKIIISGEKVSDWALFDNRLKREEVKKVGSEYIFYLA
jgi:hypothetical protein